MRNVIFLLLLVSSFCSAMAGANGVFSQQKLQQLGDTLQVVYQVVDNLGQVTCDTPLNEGKCFVAQMRFDNGPVPLSKDTIVFFSHISPIQSADSAEVMIEHIKGDLHSLVFKDGLAPNESMAFTIKAPFWHAARSDVMPNYYLVWKKLLPVVIKSTERVRDPFTQLHYSGHAGDWDSEQVYRRKQTDILPLATPEQRFADLARRSFEEVDSARVIPKVKSRSDQAERRSVAKLQFEPSQMALLSPARSMLELYGMSEGKHGSKVDVSVGGSSWQSMAAYRLSVTHQKIKIQAASELAANYALLTLMQLWDPTTQTVPLTLIEDAPVFEFRGVHLDVARHFLGKDAIDLLLAQMFQLKLNKLHLHLSDDEGWRLHIPALPELTTVGAFRCHDPQERECILPQLGSAPFKTAAGNGYLTTEQYQALVSKAASFGIEVIPSFDMPGHARAAVKAMDARFETYMTLGQPDKANEFLLRDHQDKTQYLSIQYYDDNTINPCLDSAYTFVDTILSSIQAMHQQIGVPLKTYHLGADETAGAWKLSPVCQQKGLKADDLLGYFVERVVQIGNQKGLTMAGWSDGVETSLARLKGKQIQANMWDPMFWNASQKVAEFLHFEVPTVLSFPDVLYFDFPYENHPLEPGYYWGSKATGTRKVFEFMPGHLPLHSQLWKDRMGQSYQDKSDPVDTSEVMGIQAQLWSEVTPDQDAMEYMLFPRLLAFAERAWYLPDWQKSNDDKLLGDDWLEARERDWQSFVSILAKRHLPRLAKQGINVRVPPPGALVEGGILHLRSPMPGLELEYSTDGNRWLSYAQPVSVPSSVLVRSRLMGTNRTSAVFSTKQ